MNRELSMEFVRVTEAAAIACGRSVGPVSYTHLDVYKRQDQSGAPPAADKRRIHRQA